MYNQQQRGRPGEWGGRRQQQQIAIPNAADVGQLALRGITNFARRNKVLSFSWVWGILIILLVGSGTKLSADQARTYNHIMSTVDLDAEYAASNNYAVAMQNYRATKGWFSCDGLCQRNKARMEHARAQLDEIRAEGFARMSDAKKVAGLWSEVGVGEVKDSFWEYFNAGKRFAKRQSMWDAMFMGMRHMSRDESFAEYALKMLIQVLINFSMGLVMAFFIFVFGLWTIVRSYQPDPLTAVIYFLSAACAAFAFVTSYLLLIYGAAAGSVYGVAKLAESQRRIEAGRGYGGPRVQQAQQQQQQNRPHYY